MHWFSIHWYNDSSQKDDWYLFVVCATLDGMIRSHYERFGKNRMLLKNELQEVQVEKQVLATTQVHRIEDNLVKTACFCKINRKKSK